MGQYKNAELLNDVEAGGNSILSQGPPFYVERIVSGAAESLLGSDYYLYCDTSSNSITVTLPSAASVGGKQFVIKKIDAANTVTVNPSGADTIEGETTVLLLGGTPPFSSITIVSAAPGTWRIV